MGCRRAKTNDGMGPYPTGCMELISLFTCFQTAYGAPRRFHNAQAGNLQAED